MRHTYEPKFNVKLRKRNGDERWMLNAEGTARAEHYESDANKLAEAFIERKLAESYRLVKIAEPKGSPTYQRQP